MDTTDLLLGLGAAAGAVYLFNRHGDADDRTAAQAQRIAAPPTPTSDARPVSSPAQVDAMPRPKRNAADRHRFDPIFAANGGGIPVEYLRALAVRESDLEPELRSGPAWGLMQVIEVVRDDYNRRHGTSYARTDLLDPHVNVTIAADTLHTIIASYARNHPDVPNLRTDWENSRFVELLTFGWNAGFSERGGVGHVARYLEQQGITDITIDRVHDAALAAGASRELARSDKVRWSKSVADLYLAERARARSADVAAHAA
jgi:hypothetical protein